MTTVTITGTVTSGYTLESPVTVLSITATGYVDGVGINSGGLAAYTIVNDGRVAGGHSGAYLSDGGSVTNGGSSDTTASMTGLYAGVGLGAVGTVTNFGTITDTTQAFVVSAAAYLKAGGIVTNGTSDDTSALLKGSDGVMLRNGGGTVTNFGAIDSTGAAQDNAVYFGDGGSLINGSRGDTTAAITGDGAVLARNAAGTVVNFGGIVSTANYTALNLYDGGTVTNGTAIDTGALIKGASGVVVQAGVGTVANFGTILGDSAYSVGVDLNDGGGVTNGSATDHGALIEGYYGVFITGAAGAVTNAGTILGIGGADHYGVDLQLGGTLTNGSANNENALIQGYGGVHLGGAGLSSNFGTIAALGGPEGGVGAVVLGGASLANGASRDTGALIEGYTGAEVNGGGTLTNFGTIAGAGGVGVELQSSTATLVVEAGSVIEGYALGGGGALDLGSGVGAISGLAYGYVTVSGAMATTTFRQFDTLEIGAGAAFTLSGNATVSSGEALDDAGALSAAGTIDLTGSLTTTGTLSGAGTLALGAGGEAAFDSGTSLSLSHIKVASATAAVKVGSNLTYAGAWTQTAGTVSVATGDKLTFTGAADSFAGTLTGAGSVAFSGGSDALEGATLSAASESISTSTVTLSGTVTLTGVLSAATANLIIGAGDASLTGGGELLLGNLATNRVYGTSGDATLTNVKDKIYGAGQLGNGQMTLINDAGATIDGNDTTALVINTAANTIINAGVIEDTGTGGVSILSALDNTGALTTTKGALSVSGAVTGAGAVRISVGTADFASTFTQNVTFTTSGELELAKSQTYTGTVTGFSKTGATLFDLEDIDFVSGTTKATYSGTSTAGTLTVTDGTHTAKIKLSGNYTTSIFTVASDGHGGTTVVDPTPPTSGHQINPAPLHAFAAAMAGFGATGGGPIEATSQTWRAAQPTLAKPRTQLA